MLIKKKKKKNKPKACFWQRVVRMRASERRRALSVVVGKRFRLFDASLG